MLLLTNEGGLAHELLSPKKHVDKEYYVRVAGRLSAADSAAFAEGLHLDDGLICQPAELRILTAGEESEAYVILREGKFHQIKRMLRIWESRCCIWSAFAWAICCWIRFWSGVHTVC